MVACSPGLTGEAHRRRDHEIDARLFEPLGQRFPLIHRQDDAEMRHRHVVAVDRIARPRRHRIGREMSDDLMAEQIEIDPMVGAAALRAAEQPP